MRINLKNNEKIDVALQAAQKLSRVRTLSYDDIFTEINSAEKRLIDLGMSLSNMTGAKFRYDNGYKMPNAYNGRPESTKFTFERGSSAWFITDIYRADCNHNRQSVFVNEQDYNKFYKF